MSHAIVRILQLVAAILKIPLSLSVYDCDMLAKCWITLELNYRE